MTHKIWDLKDPAATLREISQWCPLRHGSSVVAAVRLEDQAVTGAKVATRGGEGLPPMPASSDLARQLAHELVPERFSVTSEHGGMTHVLMTVVCRGGYVLAGRREMDWFRAWRYSNHFRGAFAGDVYVVTPHGWTGTVDRRAGTDPCLSIDSRPSLLVIRSLPRPRDALELPLRPGHTYDHE